MKTALVTGAYKGLGLAWCRQLVGSGYRVILTARDLRKAEEAAAQLNTQGTACYPKALDVTDEEQVKALAQWAGDTFGAMDLLVNNAGINPKDYADKAIMAKAFFLKDLDAKEMLHVLHTNSLAPLIMVKHFRPLLLKAERAVVVNISSWLGAVSQLSFGGHYGYVGSKNLLNVLNKSMAHELRQENIICVNVNPGWVQTDMGGEKARFTPAQAASNLYTHVVCKVTLDDSGKFLNYDGSEHPW
jgi:NAD(P)-dependent dehydrogenase (short-subunit alcohol dehydrogenase family)